MSLLSLYFQTDSWLIFSLFHFMLKRKLWVLCWYCQCSVAYNRLTYWRMMSMPCCKHYLKVSTPCCEHQFEDGCALLQASFYGINALLQCPLKISLPCCKYRLLKIRGITALLHIPLWQVWEVICFFLLLPCRQNMFRIHKIKISSSRRQIMRILLTHSIKTYLKVPTLCCSRNRYSFTDVFESYSLYISLRNLVSPLLSQKPLLIFFVLVYH